MAAGGIAAFGLVIMSTAEASSASAEMVWGGYQNGEIPYSALTPVRYPGVIAGQTPGQPRVSDVFMEPNAAAALLALLRAYHSETGDYLPVTEGYRPLGGQQYWWDHYNHDERYAAKPGTSNHGAGLAVDFTQGQLTSARLSWLRKHSTDFGFSPIITENWHFNYTGGVAIAGSALHLSAQEETDDEIMYIRRSATGDVAMFGGGFKTPNSDAPGRHLFSNPQEYNQWRLIVNDYNKQIDALGLDDRGKRFVPPGNMNDILGVDEANWAIICGVWGV
jgi:hypothetical protein